MAATLTRLGDELCRGFVRGNNPGPQMTRHAGAAYSDLVPTSDLHMAAPKGPESEPDLTVHSLGKCLIHFKG